MSLLPLKAYWGLLSVYLAPRWPQVALLAALLLGNVGLQLLSPLVMRQFIDAATSGGALDFLIQVALLSIGLALVTQVVSLAETYVAEDVGWTTTNQLRVDLLQHCLGLDMTFHHAHLPGELVQRLNADVGVLANFFSRFTIRLLANALLLTGALAVLWSVDWRFGLAYGLFAGAALLVLRRIRHLVLPHARVNLETAAALFGYIEERLAATEDLRSRGAIPYAMRGLYAKLRDRLRARRTNDAMFALSVGMMSLLFAAGSALALSVGGTLFSAGAITIGTVYLAVNYAALITRPLGQLSERVNELQEATAAILRVQELRSTTSAVPEVPAGAAWSLPPGPLAVAFEGVTFAYPPAGGMAAAPPARDASPAPLPGGAGAPAPTKEDSPAPPGERSVLRDITFSLAPGTVLGLLGRTGSGKTTLTRLLLRLYDPTAGRVRLGGVDLRAARHQDIRARVGLVTQEVQLFRASIRDNLTFFDRAVPDAHLQAALRALGLWEWYEALPAGLDTEVSLGGGGRAAGLSAGEAQLLAFARVFLKDPGLVILDEASSRLDPATERLVEGAISALLRERTAIVVAHRLSSVRRASEILILEDGQIAERGPREALAADRASRFATLLRTGLEVALP
ncbi:MAG TPA: ABC transporter ATP-binding protein [Chloroflexota bacterium]|nr:ABC transporter ATP-binding protein [Chloroflexota bacterium]